MEWIELKFRVEDHIALDNDLAAKLSENVTKDGPYCPISTENQHRLWDEAPVPDHKLCFAYEDVGIFIQEDWRVIIRGTSLNDCVQGIAGISSLVSTLEKPVTTLWIDNSLRSEPEGLHNKLRNEQRKKKRWKRTSYVLTAIFSSVVGFGVNIALESFFDSPEKEKRQIEEQINPEGTPQSEIPENEEKRR